MKPHLPTPDLDLGNLTRRQAAMFEHLCSRARSGVQREIGMHEAAAALPMASPSVVAEHWRALRECRREADLIAGLHNRLTRLRTAPPTEAERDRLARARSARPDLTAAEADLVLHGMIDVAELETAKTGEVRAA